MALFAFRLFIAAVLVQPALAAESDVATMPQPVERASADDCAIFVEVGKSRMNWGATAPDYAFYSEFDRTGGGTYLEDCPWKQLGLAEPLTPAQQTEKSFFMTRPSYSGDEATLDLQFSISGKVVDGTKTPPFIRLETCRVEKRDDHWRFVACKLKMVT